MAARTCQEPSRARTRNSVGGLRVRDPASDGHTEAGHVVRVDVVQDVLAQELLGPPSEQPLDGRALVLNDPVLADYGDDIGDVLQHPGDTLLRFPELGDIEAGSTVLAEPGAGVLSAPPTLHGSLPELAGVPHGQACRDYLRSGVVVKNGLRRAGLEYRRRPRETRRARGGRGSPLANGPADRKRKEAALRVRGSIAGVVVMALAATAGNTTTRAAQGKTPNIGMPGPLPGGAPSH